MAFLRQLIVLGSARTGAETLLAVRGVVLASVLGPEVFGIWAALRLAMQYAGVAAWGVLRSLELMVARAARLGPADRPSTSFPVSDESAAWGRTAVGVLMAIFGMISLAAGALALAVETPWLRLVLGGLALTLVVERLRFYATTFLRACGDSRRLALFEVLHGFLQLTIVCLLALSFGLRGAIAGLALAGAASVLLMARDVPWRPTFPAGRVRALIRIGFPLSISGLLQTGLLTADRVIVGALGGPVLLGLYALAVAVAAFGHAAAQVLRSLALPHVYHRSQGERTVPELRAFMASGLLPLATLAPPVIGLAALAATPLVILALPQYAAALPATRLLIFAGAFDAVGSLAALGVVAGGLERRLPWWVAGPLVLNIVLAFAALQSGLSLEAVAAGALFARACWAAGIALLLAAVIGERAPVWLVLKLLLPTVWCAVVVVALGHLFPTPRSGDVASAFGCYVLSMLPLAPALAAHSLRLGRALRKPGIAAA